MPAWMPSAQALRNEVLRSDEVQSHLLLLTLHQRLISTDPLVIEEMVPVHVLPRPLRVLAVVLAELKTIVREGYI